MLEERQEKKNTIHRVELMAIIIGIIAIIFMFTFQTNTTDKDREIRNAIRYQDLSIIADGLWRLSVESPDFTSQIRLLSEENTACQSREISVDFFKDFLVPQYLESIPTDPSGGDYYVGFSNGGRIEVCSLFGEKDDGALEVFSITR